MWHDNLALRYITLHHITFSSAWCHVEKTVKKTLARIGPAPRSHAVAATATPKPAHNQWMCYSLYQTWHMHDLFHIRMMVCCKQQTACRMTGSPHDNVHFYSCCVVWLPCGLQSPRG